MIEVSPKKSSKRYVHIALRAFGRDRNWRRHIISENWINLDRPNGCFHSLLLHRILFCIFEDARSNNKFDPFSQANTNRPSDEDLLSAAASRSKGTSPVNLRITIGKNRMTMIA